MKKLEEYVRSIPDFPEPGIIFRDVTTNPTVHDIMITILYILLTNIYSEYNILPVQNIY